MIDRLSAAALRPAASQPAEVVSVQFDIAREQYETFLDALQKAGVDLSGIQARAADRRQELDGISPLRRIFDPEGVARELRSSAAQPPAEAPAKAAAATPPESFQPAFLNAVVKSGLGPAVPLNPYYFATQATAQWMADRYGTGEVVALAPGGEGGPFTITERQWHFRLADGSLINAGVLAAHFANCDELLADQLVRRELNQFIQMQQSGVSV